ncbi:MAG TPA: alpha/beta hydrolase family protein [Pyrinomonadaceae bacterium]|nr:alpha/beta hydrolase family protein [Pyrinomonadaceae bacterium]
MTKLGLRQALLALLLTTQALAQVPQTPRGRIQTIPFQSRLLVAKAPYNVILPADYYSSRTSRYPVLYLLHGLSGHYADWLTRTNVADYAARYRMIIVMPEGNDGWYTDSVAVPTDKYESYILEELMADVTRRFRTIQARYGRGVAGLSMGGYGALKFGVKYPDRFVFVASMSGALGVIRRDAARLGPAGESILRTFGPLDSPARKANDLFALIEEMPAVRIASLPYFYFDCGTEDVPEIFGSNRELSELMLKRRVRHEYRELPGDHSWEYWDRQVQEVLKIAAREFSRRG